MSISFSGGSGSLETSEQRRRRQLERLAQAKTKQASGREGFTSSMSPSERVRAGLPGFDRDTPFHERIAQTEGTPPLIRDIALAGSGAGALGGLARAAGPGLAAAGGGVVSALAQKAAQLRDQVAGGSNRLTTATNRAAVDPILAAQQGARAGAGALTSGARGLLSGVRAAPGAAANVARGVPNLAGSQATAPAAVGAIAGGNQLVSGTGEAVSRLGDALFGRAQPSTATTPSPTAPTSAQRSIFAGIGVPNLAPQTPPQSPTEAPVAPTPPSIGAPVDVGPPQRGRIPAAAQPQPITNAPGPDQVVRGGPFTGEQPGQGVRGEPPAAPGEGVPNLRPTASDPRIADLDRQIQTDIDGLRSEIANSRAPDVQAIFAAQGRSLLSFLDEQERTLREQAEREGTQIDPATQFTIDRLREALGEQLTQAEEDLNRRGLLHSGILLEVTSNIRKGAVSEEGRILAERLSRIQDNLNQRLAALSGQRVDAMSNFGMAGAQAQTQSLFETDRRRDDLIGRLVDARQNQRDSLVDQDQFSHEQEFRAQENDLTRQADEARQRADQAFRAGQSEIARAWEAEQARLDREAEAARDAANNAAAMARTQAGRSGGSSGDRSGGGTSGGTVASRDELGVAIADMQNSGDSREVALANLQASQQYYTATYGPGGYQLLLQAAQTLPPQGSTISADTLRGYRGRVGGPVYLR